MLSCKVQYQLASYMKLEDCKRIIHSCESIRHLSCNVADGKTPVWDDIPVKQTFAFLLCF